YYTIPPLFSFPTRRSSDLPDPDGQSDPGQRDVSPVFVHKRSSICGYGHEPHGVVCHGGHGSADLRGKSLAEVRERPHVHSCVHRDRKSTRLNSSHGSISYA